ncbi:MAG: helix-turn-helix domain-containing protein [Longimicrobiales bacterium]
MPDPTHRRVARRIRARRERLGLSQEALADASGFNHRQTITAIEAGDRSIAPEELAALAGALGVGVAYFTDPFVATGEAAFSFRAEAGIADRIAEFEEVAGQWIATYRELEPGGRGKQSLLLPALSLTARSSYEDALAAADDVRERLGLGAYPAERLEAALEREWGIPVLYFDGRSGISGAATRLGGLQAVFINRAEASGRRNFDLAHELFHLLTWDSMPPRRIDDARPERDEKRVEQLADNFASALLLPEPSVRELWAARPDGSPTEWMAATAQRFRVSGPALKCRLLRLGLVEEGGLPGDEALARAAGAVERFGPVPQLFNATFAERVHTAVESGRLSLRRASRILGLELADFAELLRSYGRPLSYEV